MKQNKRKRLARLVFSLCGVLFVLLSVWQIGAAARGLEVAAVESSLPLTIVAPAGVMPGSRPLVLVGHGFAASGLVMRGFAFTLAHAGYVVVLWDFDGHGANPHPWRSRPLIVNAETALAEVQARGWVAPGRVAILGHSMGSGVALEFGQAYPDTAATIAVSPVGQPVTPELPHNLLLLAGSLETPFVRNAERRLAEAGGSGGDPALGTARQLTVIRGVEHASILFAPAAHRAAAEWLDATFGPQPGARAYVDRRIAWYGLGLLGVLWAFSALAPPLLDRLTGQQLPERRPARLWAWRLAALGMGALLATGVLWLAGVAGLGLSALGGIRIGGYLIAWFGLAGAFSLLLLWQRPAWPSHRALLGGAAAFAALWLGVGLLAHLAWYPWLLIWERLRLWPLGALLLLPWFLSVGRLSGGEAPPKRTVVAQLGRWLAQSVALLAGLYLAIRLSPELGFLSMILPAFPAILGLHALAAGRLGEDWAFALSGALFTSWVLLALFPLQ
jgi:pimeloyl-ACP methyl ester carboxylesterase